MLLRSFVKPITLTDVDAPPPMRHTLGRLFTYLRPYRKRMLWTLSIYVVCVTITQLYPFIDRILIDDHIAVGKRKDFCRCWRWPRSSMRWPGLAC
ncbi:MAG: hypothetical protein R2867_44880 [Caldilineaceae bacterium]